MKNTDNKKIIIVKNHNNNFVRCGCLCASLFFENGKKSSEPQIKLIGSTGFCVENSYFMNMQTNKKLEIKEVLDIVIPLKKVYFFIIFVLWLTVKILEIV